MDAVYTEAKALLNAGFRYWFNDEEITELYKESEDFQVQTAEMDYYYAVLKSQQRTILIVLT